MTKILIIGYGSRFNKGDVALLNSKIRILQKLIPDAIFTVCTEHPEVQYTQHNVKLIGFLGVVSRSPLKILKNVCFISKCIIWSIGDRLLGLNFDELITASKGLDEYINADLIITTGGDTLTEDYGFYSVGSQILNIMFGILLKKPIVIYGETVGPFRNALIRVAARYLLKRVKLITLREDLSKKNVLELGINKVPIHITTDSAFVLQPAPKERTEKILIKEGFTFDMRPLVGVSVSKLISSYNVDFDTTDDKYSSYTKFMADILNHIHMKLDAFVILVPHVIEPWGNDDRITGDHILRKIKNPNRVIHITNDYTPEELKGIISICNLFIGARMHACISAISMHVPTIAIAYSQKFYGILGRSLGQERWIYDVGHFDSNSLIRKIDEAWSRREETKKHLQSRMKEIKQQAWHNGRLVKDLLDRTRGSNQLS